MNLPPHRIALVTLILLLLASVAMWWWAHRLLPASQLTPASPELAPLREQAPATRAAPRLTARIELARLEASFKQCGLDMTEQRMRRWQALGTSTDTESRLTHALMAASLDEVGQQTTTSSLLDALAKAVPDDAEVAWYRANNCPKNRSCDREQAIARVLELEPDNLAGWLLALNEAVNRNAEEASVQELLARAGEAKYYDTRDGESFVRIYQAIKDIPLPESCRSDAQQRAWEMYTKSKTGQMSADMAAISAMAVVSAEISPTNGVARMCQQQDDQQLAPSRVKGCKAILAKLVDANSFIDQMIGIRFMINLTQGEEGALWRERYRRLQWLQQENSRDISFNRDAMLRRMTDGEIPAMRSKSLSAGRWPPPANWLPHDAHARSLIQTGRPPPKAR